MVVWDDLVHFRQCDLVFLLSPLLYGADCSDWVYILPEQQCAPSSCLSFVNACGNLMDRCDVALTKFGDKLNLLSQ